MARPRCAYRLRSHTVFKVDLGQFGQSALTDDAIEVPKDRDLAAIGEGIPSTYVPARNTVFLSLGLALAESLSVRHLFIGVNALDYSGYPDCRPDFIRAFERLANAGTRAADGGAPYQVHAPLLELTKAQIDEGAQARGRLRADAFVLRGRPRWHLLWSMRRLRVALGCLRNPGSARPDPATARSEHMAYTVKEVFLTSRARASTAGDEPCSSASPAAISGAARASPGASHLPLLRYRICRDGRTGRWNL